MQIGKNFAFSFALSSACTFTAAAVKVGRASEIKINAIYFVFLSACTTFLESRLRLNHANWKKLRLFLCIVFGLHLYGRSREE